MDNPRRGHPLRGIWYEEATKRQSDKATKYVEIKMVAEDTFVSGCLESVLIRRPSTVPYRLEDRGRLAKQVAEVTCCLI